jgi:hypothetical protein
MSRARRYRIVGIVLASILGGIATLTACSEQAEGDRCQVENGNEDCAAGLVCLASSASKGFNGGQGFVNAPYNSSDRCCPLNRETATHPACVLVSGTGTTDATAPDGETGPTPDATPPDTGTDTSTTPDADAGGDADGD